jgi:hypothetical protein
VLSPAGLLTCCWLTQVQSQLADGSQDGRVLVVRLWPVRTALKIRQTYFPIVTDNCFLARKCNGVLSNHHYGSYDTCVNSFHRQSLYSTKMDTNPVMIYHGQSRLFFASIGQSIHAQPRPRSSMNYSLCDAMYDTIVATGAHTDTKQSK